MFFAVVRFSPPSQEIEAVKRKAEAKNNSPDSQEPTLNLLVAAKGEARGRAGVLRVSSWWILRTPCNGDFLRLTLIFRDGFSIIPNKMITEYRIQETEHRMEKEWIRKA